MILHQTTEMISVGQGFEILYGKLETESVVAANESHQMPVLGAVCKATRSKAKRKEKTLFSLSYEKKVRLRFSTSYYFQVIYL